MSGMDIWIICVGIALWIGSVVLGWMSARQRDQAWREFLDRGTPPMLRDTDGS